MRFSRCLVIVLCAFALLMPHSVFATGEIKTTDISGKTLYAVYLNPSGQVWNGATFAAITNVNWSTYGVVITEQGTTGIFVGNFPTGISTAGRYSTLIYEEATSPTEAVGDKLIASGSVDWTGTTVVTLTAINASVAGVQASSTNNGTAIATGNGQTTAAAIGTDVWTTPATRTVTGGTVTASNFVAAPTVAQVAAGILATPANLLATNATGQVAASNLPTDYLNSAEGTNLTNAAGQTTAANLAAGVWNAVSASYAIAGSTGAKLAAAGSAGDPWATLLTSESTVGSFGATVKANLDTNVGSRLAAGNVTVGGYATGQDPATLMFAASFVTIPTTHTTTGVSEVLTWKQFEALSDATLGGDNTTTSPNVVASGTATVTYYLRGQAKVAASVVAVSTVTYDATKNQIGRQILIAQPFPTVN